MMKKSISISVDSEKLSALEMYLEQKNLNLNEELNKCIDGLYQKYVPKNIRDFIEMRSTQKPAKKPKNTEYDDISITNAQTVNRHMQSISVSKCLPISNCLLNHNTNEFGTLNTERTWSFSGLQRLKYNCRNWPTSASQLGYIIASLIWMSVI